jgi:hypothetical protein
MGTKKWRVTGNKLQVMGNGQFFLFSQDPMTYDPLPITYNLLPVTCIL